MCVMSVVDDTLIHLHHAWYNQIHQLSHFNEMSFVSAQLALCLVRFLCESMNYQIRNVYPIKVKPTEKRDI